MSLILFLILLALSAAFSGAETAYFSLDAGDRARLGSDRKGLGGRILRLLERSTDLLSAILIGNLLVNTAISVLASSLCLQWFGPAGLALAVPIVTLLLLLLGEITPKLLALQMRLRLARLLRRPLEGWLWLNGPLLKVVGALVDGLLRILPEAKGGARPLRADELQTACDLAVEEGKLTDTEGRSLGRLLRLEELEVIHIMTPRTAVVSLRRDMSLRQMLGVARRAGYNRYPVLDRHGSRPVGLFHLKDLLQQAPSSERPLENSLRELLFVPESKDVATLLDEMAQGDAHLAAVVDEHGDFTGIVTMADCLQALLGAVGDTPRFDTELLPFGGGGWVVGGRADRRELQETCGVALPPSRDYVTIAGFLMARLGRIPQPGDAWEEAGFRFEILEMTGHRVDRVQVAPLDATEVVAGPDEGSDA